MLKTISTATIVVAAACGGLWATAAEPSIRSTTQVSTQSVYAVPRMENLVVDGRADDWGTRGFRVDAMADTGSGRVRSAADFANRLAVRPERRCI